MTIFAGDSNFHLWLKFLLVPTLIFFCEIGEMDLDFEKELLEEECEGDFWCGMAGGL